MKIVVVSNSTLGVVAKCSTMEVLSALRYRALEPNGALEVGSMVHAALARYLKGGEPADCIAGLEQEYRNLEGAYDGWLFGEKHLDRKHGRPQYALRNIKRIMQEWFDRHPFPSPFPLVIPPEWVEVNFALPLDEFNLDGEHYRLVITGQLDALGEEGSELYTVEHKTVGRIADWWENKFEGDPQNTEFEWAAEQTTGREVLGTYLNAIGTAQVPDSDKSCSKGHTFADLGQEPPPGLKRTRTLYSECGHLHVDTKVFLVTRNPDLTEQWKKDTVSLAKDFVKLQPYIADGILGATLTRTKGKYNDACTFCDYRKWCIHSARNPQFVDSMMGTREYDGSGRIRSGVYEEEEWLEAQERCK